MPNLDALTSMRKVFDVLNQMLRDGLIDAYALGGAIAASFFVEPFATEDIDFFVHFTADVSDLDPLRPLIDYLEPMGYKAKGVEFEIEDWLVQFIPIYNELVDEGVQESSNIEEDGIKVNVLRPEYLVAVMLQLGRPKDLVRAKIFIDQGVVDMGVLSELIDRFDLGVTWKRVRQL